MIIPLSSAIRDSQHPHIEDPNYLRTQNVPGLHTLGPQFFMYEKHTTSSCTITPILHVRKTYHIYMQNYPNSSCTKNTPGLHAQLPQFFMYEKHARPTYTITPILHVRKTYHIYMQNYPNSSCTKNTPGLHAQLPQFFMYEKHARPTYTITPILHVQKKPGLQKKLGRQTKNGTRVIVAWSPGRTAPPPRAGLGAPHNHRSFI